MLAIVFNHDLYSNDHKTVSVHAHSYDAATLVPVVLLYFHN